MGIDYRAVLLYGFPLNIDWEEAEKIEEVLEEENDCCQIVEISKYDEIEIYLCIRETVKVSDWYNSNKIELPIKNDKWDKILTQASKSFLLFFEEPSWYLCVEIC